MRGLWLLWLGLPSETQVLVAGTLVTTLVDVVRLFLPRIDGRWVHLLTLVVGGTAGLFAALAACATGCTPVVHTLSIFLQATVAAIGLNEVKRGPGRLGKSREEANARQFLTEHHTARRNRRDAKSQPVAAPSTPASAATQGTTQERAQETAQNMAGVRDTDGGAG